MRIAKFDRGLKEDRNLNNKDDEFHNIQGHSINQINMLLAESVIYSACYFISIYS